jgi:hypothetical protein
MVTGGEIMLRCRANALLLPPKSAICHGNLGWGAFVVTVVTRRLFTSEKLNQAHPVRKASAVALF